MYTIKEAAARSGVGAPTIRAWERRYGVVRPTRTAAGYRLYDDATIAVLQSMRTLIADGWTASEAARSIASGETTVDGSPGDGVSTSGDRGVVAPRSTSSRTAAADRAELRTAFVRAAEAASPARTEAALDAIFAAGSFEAIVDDVLLPATAALGASWETGRLSVGGEHAASAAVGRRLAAAYQAAGVAIAPAVVVGLPPGSRHELGALAFATALRRTGVGVLYLGADVPIDTWVEMVSGGRRLIAVIGVVTPSDRTPARRVVEALLDRSHAVVALGGPAAAGIVRPSDRVRLLPQAVVDAAASVVSLVRRRD